MKNRKLRAPSPALIVATCALVFSMAGTGYAVNQINGKTIKKGTVAGKALKKNTLTGTQINESKLGTVPKAKTADSATSASTAANAALLAGQNAAEFAKNANFVRVFKTMNVGDSDQTLVSVGDIAVKLSCQASGGLDYLRVYVTTGSNGALLYSQEDGQDPLNTDTAPNSAEIIDNLNETSGGFDYNHGYDETGFVLSSDSTHLITLLEGASTRVLNRGGHGCIYGGTFIVE